MPALLANNINTTLAAAVATTDTSIDVVSVANFPTLGADDIIPLTLSTNVAGVLPEVVYVTAISGTTLTVSRGQEGTTAQNWIVGNAVRCGPTAGTIPPYVEGGTTITTVAGGSLSVAETPLPGTTTASEYTATYVATNVSAQSATFGAYYEVGSKQTNGAGGAIKINHFGAGDGIYLNLQAAGFGYEAAGYVNGGTGFLATFQASSLTSSIGYNATWGYTTIPAYGLFYASQSAARAFVVQSNYTGANGYPQYALMSTNLATTLWGINNDGSRIGTATASPGVAAPASPLVSGTVYQNTTAYFIMVYQPVTYSPTSTAAATCAVALGATNAPATISTESQPAGVTAGTVRTFPLTVPPGWYYSFTVTNATLSDATLIVI